TWHAIRTARAYTGRSKVVKFEGHFHGYHDYLGYSSWPPLDQAGPENAPAAVPESGGIPPQLQQFRILPPSNDAAALERAIARSLATAPPGRAAHPPATGSTSPRSSWSG